jgi:putative aminopeptidase FrvX
MYLEQLSNAFGVSGVENDVRKIIIEAAKPYVDDWRVDTMGNLFVTRKCRSDTPDPPLKVMVTAHMDEVGFMIAGIKKDGRLKFSSVGSFDPRVLLGKAVVVGEKRLAGVIGLKPIHLLNRDDRGKVGDIDSMYIDIGATDDKANEKINVGDFATFSTKFGWLGGQSRYRKDRGLVKGKAFDDRAGCAVLLELLKGDYPLDLIGVFTVQEEIGLRGARVAAYAAEPDCCLVRLRQKIYPTSSNAPVLAVRMRGQSIWLVRAFRRQP